jgi:hypothetical protein
VEGGGGGEGVKLKGSCDPASLRSDGMSLQLREASCSPGVPRAQRINLKGKSLRERPKHLS